MKRHQTLWQCWTLPLLVGLLVGCAPERHISHAEKMEALGEMFGVSAEEAEAQLNRNQARKRQEEQEAAQQAAIARQQAEAQRLQQQLELQSLLNQPAAEMAGSDSDNQTPTLAPTTPSDRPAAKQVPLCPNQKNIERSRSSGAGSPVCVE